MKAVKRERYGEKENDRLVKMLTAAGEYPQVFGEVKKEIPDHEEGGGGGGGEVEVTEISSKKSSVSVLFEPRRALRAKKTRRMDTRNSRMSRKDKAEQEERDATTVINDDDEEGMEIEGQDGKVVAEKVFSKRTMMDQFGNYPAWMNKRKMKTQQKKNKRITKRRALSVAGGKKKKMR